MRLIELTDKETLDDFVAANGGDFLQSWEWGEFQRTVGWEVVRWGVTKEEKLVAVATLIKKPLVGGFSYWFCPRGPVVKFQIPNSRFQDIFNFLISNLAKTAKKERVIFFRFEPLQTFAIPDSKFQILNSIDIEPSQTSVLDLTKSNADLLAALSQKTRYNIRLAEKRGVKIKRGGQDDFAVWWQLLQTTAARDNFRLHGREYYQQMLKLAGGRLYLAKNDEQVLAGIFIVHFGSSAVYLHGASAAAGRNLMAPYLLQWTAISDAKNNGLTSYDFYGIDERRWPGVSRFKLGFGGQNKACPGTFDLVFKSLYYRIYQALRRVRRLV